MPKNKKEDAIYLTIGVLTEERPALTAEQS